MKITIIGDSLIKNVEHDDLTVISHPGITLEFFVNNFIDLYEDVEEPVFCFGINDLNNGIKVHDNYLKLVEKYPNCVLILPPFQKKKFYRKGKLLFKVNCINTFNCNYETVDDILIHFNIQNNDKWSQNHDLNKAIMNNDYDRVKELYDKNIYTRTIVKNEMHLQKVTKNKQLFKFLASLYTEKELEEIIVHYITTIGIYLLKYDIVTSLPIKTANHIYNFYYPLYSDLIEKVNNKVNLRAGTIYDIIMNYDLSTCKKLVQKYPEILEDKNLIKEALENSLHKNYDLKSP